LTVGADVRIAPQDSHAPEPLRDNALAAESARLLEDDGAVAAIVLVEREEFAKMASPASDTRSKS